MTVADRIPEILAGPHICAALLDGSPEQSAEFGAWFVPLWHTVIDDPGIGARLMFRGWARILHDARVLHWYDGLGLPRTLLRRGPVAVLRTDNWQAAGDAGLVCEAACWAEGGVASVVVPVFHADAEARRFELLDAAAIDAVDPDRWARLTGIEPVLGWGPGFRPWLPWPERLRLHRGPMGFLAGGAAPGSACVLDWSAAEARDLLAEIDRGAVTAVCDDDAHAAELRAMARPRRNALKVEVAATDRRDGHGADGPAQAGPDGAGPPVESSGAPE